MTVGLDTSVVVRLLSAEPREMAELALRELMAWTRRGERVLVSEWVLAESYYALQHHYDASKKDTLAALRSFLATPGVETTAEASEVLATPSLESAKPLQEVVPCPSQEVPSKRYQPSRSGRPPTHCDMRPSHRPQRALTTTHLGIV